MPLLSGAGGRGGFESAKRAYRRNLNRARKQGHGVGGDEFIQIVFRDESSDVGPNLDALFQSISGGEFLVPIVRSLAVKTSEYMTQEAAQFENEGTLATSFQIREISRSDASTSFEVFSEVAYAATWTHEEGDPGNQGKPSAKSILNWMLTKDQDWYLMEDGDPVLIEPGDLQLLTTVAFIIRAYISFGWPPKSGTLYDLSDGHRMYDYITAAYELALEDAEETMHDIGDFIINEFG